MKEKLRELVKKRLKEQNFHPVKKLGQNFLVDEEAVKTIVKRIQRYDIPLVEIGPGLGALTSHFRKDNILLVEKDKKLALYWKEKSWRVLCQDALKLKNQQLSKDFLLFGNLPYEIAGSLIIKATVEGFSNPAMIFLIQKEVADRVRSPAGSKNYGLLSVISQTYWKVTPILKIPKHCFYPVPQVSGQVLEFERRDPPCPPLPFLSFVKQCFQHRRKMLFKKLPVLQAKKHLKEKGFNPECRAEELSPKDFVTLFKESEIYKSKRFPKNSNRRGNY